MPNSYKKRRKRTDPIRRLRSEARRELGEVLRDESMDLSDRESARLADAATEFANPWICRDRDALLPPHRPDIRKEFFRRALHLQDRSAGALLAIGRELAPAPHPSGPPCRIRLPTYGEVKRAFQHDPRQRRQRKATPTT